MPSGTRGAPITASTQHDVNLVSAVSRHTGRARRSSTDRHWSRCRCGPDSRRRGKVLWQRRMQGVRDQLADPLTFNGYALIANSGVTGALGLVYWLLMARLYPTAAVGRVSAVYAAMNLLAGITAQNFNGALTRFIPQAGLRTRTFITRSYAVSAGASVGVSVLFLLTIRSWGGSYSELGGPVTGLIFVACVVAWAIFTLQDSVLVGLRSAVWVLVENGIFGVVKLVLLVLLVTALPRHLGIYVSWMLPAVVAVPLINMLIFRRLVPQHTLLTRDFQPPSNRQIGRFLAGDYSGALCLLATGSLVPVVVAVRTDVRQTAYFYVAWVIAGMVDMIGINMGMSLTVEGSFDVGALAVNCRRGSSQDGLDAAALCHPPRPLCTVVAEALRVGLRRARHACSRAACRGHGAPGSDRAVSGRAARPEPDFSGGPHPVGPRCPDAGARRLS